MRATSFRLGALVAAGVLVVHEARYRAAPDEAMREAGHGYLGVITALVGLAIALAAGRYLSQLARRQPDEAAPGRRPLVLWLAVTGAVLAGYIGQEVAAGALAPGHPAGVLGLLGQSGWLAIPVAMAVAGGIVLLHRCAAAVLELRWRGVRTRAARAAGTSSPAARPVVPRGRLFARYLVGRAPPSALSR